MPRGGLDFIYGDAFPHETNMDRLHGVDFDKGCYVGQEVVSRMQHRGTARTRTVRVVLDGPAPEAGRQPSSPATSRWAPWARRLTAAGLALMRIDRVADALDAGMPLTSGGLAHPPRRAGRRPVRTEADRGMTRSARLHADGLTRCPWPGEDPFYMAYHDTEWGVPEYDDRALYEKLILDGFQAGLSWITILRKRDNFRRAFDDFQPEKIARYNAKKVHALMNDAGIVRNRAKIEGTVNSAKSYLKIMEERPGLLEIPVGFRRRQAEGQSVQDHRQRAGLDAGLDQDVQGAGRARLQIRRPDHRLCLHAGDRHGQRPSGDLLLP